MAIAQSPRQIAVRLYTRFDEQNCYVGQPLKFRQAWALSIIHDVPVRAMLGADATDLDLNAVIWRVMDTFGRKQARFRGYWENDDKVRVEPTGALASIYTHPTNGHLLAIANLAARAQTVRVHLPRLANDHWSATDALTGKRFRRRGGGLALRLASLDFALVRVGPSP